MKIDPIIWLLLIGVALCFLFAERIADAKRWAIDRFGLGAPHAPVKPWAGLKPRAAPERQPSTRTKTVAREAEKPGQPAPERKFGNWTQFATGFPPMRKWPWSTILLGVGIVIALLAVLHECGERDAVRRERAETNAASARAGEKVARVQNDADRESAEIALETERLRAELQSLRNEAAHVFASLRDRARSHDAAGAPAPAPSDDDFRALAFAHRDIVRRLRDAAGAASAAPAPDRTAPGEFRAVPAPAGDGA